MPKRKSRFIKVVVKGQDEPKAPATYTYMGQTFTVPDGPHATKAPIPPDDPEQAAPPGSIRVPISVVAPDPNASPWPGARAGGGALIPTSVASPEEAATMLAATSRSEAKAPIPPPEPEPLYPSIKHTR
jgi:hypothetical protein